MFDIIFSMIILLAILIPILILLREFKIQEWRKVGVDTKTVVSASSIFALPVFIFTLGYILLSSDNSFTFNNKWLFYSGIWIITCFVTNIMSYYIMRNISMTQFGIFTKVASILFSIIADIFIFDFKFPVLSIIAITLMFIGGITIDNYNEKSKKENIKTSLLYVILVIFLIRFIDIFQTASFKELAIIQKNPTFFVAFLQTALFIPLSFIGFNGMVRAVKKGLIKIKDMIYLAFLIVIICFAEPYVYKNLPLTILTSLGLLRIGFSYIYDVKFKNLEKNRKSLIALGMIIIGSLILVLIY